MRTFIIVTLALAMLIDCCEADDRSNKREHHNYIIERQEAGQVQGPPTSRRIIGTREIDIYPNGLMFEGNSVVGVEPKR